MDPEALVEQYVNAWNCRDADALLELCAPDAFFADMYWAENCSRRELREYFEEYFADDGNWYAVIGKPLVFDNGVMYRYSAHAWQNGVPGGKRFEGSELLLLRGDRIVAMIDYYCHADPAVLTEVARAILLRHGRMRPVSHGMPSARAARFRNSIAALLDREKLFLDPNLTLSQVAERIDCPVTQLADVMRTHFGSSFYRLIDQRRVVYAGERLAGEADDPETLRRISAECGFRSYDRFEAAFEQYFEESPADYLHRHAR